MLIILFRESWGQESGALYDVAGSSIPLTIYFPCMIQAPGTSEFFDVMFKHWGDKLKVEQQERLKAREMTGGDGVIIIDDDGVDLEQLESKSLEDAKQGIIVSEESFDLVDDGYSIPEAEVAKEPDHHELEIKASGVTAIAITC